MVNISLLEKSIPVAPIKIAALDSCKELAQQVDSHLVQFRKELDSHNQSGLNFRGYTADTFLLTASVHALAQVKRRASSMNPCAARTSLLW